MTDIENFRDFLKKFGVAYTEGENQHIGFKDQRVKSAKYIGVATTHFHFDETGTFLGAEAEDMQYFVPREVASG